MVLDFELGRVVWPHSPEFAAITPYCFSNLQLPGGRETILCPLYSNSDLISENVHSFIYSQFMAYFHAGYYNETIIWIGSLCTIREELCGLKDRSLETGSSDGDIHRMLWKHRRWGGRREGKPAQRRKSLKWILPESEEPGRVRQGAERHVQREAQGERVLQTSVTEKSGVVRGG